MMERLLLKDLLNRLWEHDPPLEEVVFATFRLVVGWIFLMEGGADGTVGL